MVILSVYRIIDYYNLTAWKQINAIMVILSVCCIIDDYVYPFITGYNQLKFTEEVL